MIRFTLGVINVALLFPAGSVMAAMVANVLMTASLAGAETVSEPDPHSPLLRSETDGFVHYTLEACSHERGLAAIR